MSAPIDPYTLTIDTALSICNSWPQDHECAVCLEPLEVTPNTASDSNVNDKRVAKIKVCGDSHHFHHLCIMTWLRSGTLMASIFPVDRRLCYSSSHSRVRARSIGMMITGSFLQIIGHDQETVSPFNDTLNTHVLGDSIDNDESFPSFEELRSLEVSFSFDRLASNATNVNHAPEVAGVNEIPEQAKSVGIEVEQSPNNALPGRPRETIHDTEPIQESLELGKSGSDAVS